MCYSKHESLVRPEVNQAIDALEIAMLDRFKKIDCPLDHTFMPGMYMRTIFMPAGSKVTSKIHRFKHPFFVLKGKVRVWQDGEGWVLIQAPYSGITLPGTRRVLDVLEDTVWTTVHSNPDDTEDLEIIEERIIEKHENQLINSIPESKIELP